MIAQYAQAGRLAAIWLRAARLEAPTAVDTAEIAEAGLLGDHGRAGKRAVTLFQAEHLPVVAAMLGRDAVDAALLRRNLVVSGLNLNALRQRRITIGSTVLEITGVCAPCSRMEKALGKGGYSALRGHGGWCARVVEPGRIRIGDHVRPVDQPGPNQAGPNQD